MTELEYLGITEPLQNRQHAHIRRLPIAGNEKERRREGRRWQEGKRNDRKRQERRGEGREDGGEMEGEGGKRQGKGRALL